MGKNIRGLDALHQVMKGDMTIDQACEGMTDDFEIGHVSHRKDGDYRKVAQGKWVPVKAAGGGQQGEKPEQTYNGYKYKGKNIIRTRAHGYPAYRIEGEKETSYTLKDILTKIDNAGQGQAGAGEKASEKPASGIEAWKKDEGVAGRDLYTSPDGQHKIRVNRNYLAGRRTFSLGTKENGKWEDKGEFDTIEEAVAAAKPAEQKGEPQGAEPDDDGPNTAMQDERNQRKFREHIQHAIPMGKEEEIALNRISSYFESGKRNASDAIDNYADHLIKENMENGNNNEAQERAVMRIAHAIGYGHELHDKIKRGRNGYDFGYADEQGSFYEGDDDGFLEPNITEPEPDDEPPYEYDNPAPKMTPDAAPRLTRDTKIRLSQVKREQTQDKTYNVGETSQRKDGLYKKVAPGKWAPVKGGGSAGAPAGGKTEVNPITGKPLRPETVAYAKQKKADAEQKRNTEKTAGGFTLAQNDKIKNAALDVITKRRGERLTAKNLKRDYKMSDEEANETVRRVNEYFENLQKDRKEFSKR